MFPIAQLVFFFFWSKFDVFCKLLSGQLSFPTVSRSGYLLLLNTGAAMKYCTLQNDCNEKWCRWVPRRCCWIIWDPHWVARLDVLSNTQYLLSVGIPPPHQPNHSPCWHNIALINYLSGWCLRFHPFHSLLHLRRQPALHSWEKKNPQKTRQGATTNTRPWWLSSLKWGLFILGFPSSLHSTQI